jgi:hypothetical protein
VATLSGEQSSGATRIRPSHKIIAYVAAWLLALFATDPSGGLWSVAYLFPLGLAAFVNLHKGNDGGWGIFAACVGVYLVHGFLYFRSKTFRSTILWFVILVLLLVCNVSGCRAMVHGH